MGATQCSAGKPGMANFLNNIHRNLIIRFLQIENCHKNISKVIHHWFTPTVVGRQKKCGPIYFHVSFQTQLGKVKKVSQVKRKSIKLCKINSSTINCKLIITVRYLFLGKNIFINIYLNTHAPLFFFFISIKVCNRIEPNCK